MFDNRGLDAVVTQSNVIQGCPVAWNLQIALFANPTEYVHSAFFKKKTSINQCYCWLQN